MVSSWFSWLDSNLYLRSLQIMLYAMNNLEVEKLGDRDESRFVIRTFKKNWHCELFIPRRGSLGREDAKKIEQAIIYESMLQQAFEFTRSHYDDHFMIKNYNFSYNSDYFKLDQEYYSRTLRSVSPLSIKYEDKLHIVTEIAKIVKHYTKENICMRALRPEVLAYSKIGNKIQIKLIWIDYGVSLEKHKTDTKKIDIKQFSEVEAFVAPEVKFRRNHTKKADVWSLGAIFYYLLFGSTYGIKVKPQSVELQFPPQTPKWLQKILGHILEEDPTKRCSIEACLQYLRPMKCCAETASKMMPKDNYF